MGGIGRKMFVDVSLHRTLYVQPIGTEKVSTEDVESIYAHLASPAGAKEANETRVC